MAYKALYRQFRPRRFSEIKDQSTVSEIIKNQVKNGCPSHAYIFSGPRGTGKTSTAKILACALNCLEPENGEPCLKCSNCKAALNDTMPDIIEMDAASNTGVDDARALREKINLMPVLGKYKIYIIDEVHMLSNSAFNALLKTIEEPPEYAVFILATTELRKLPRTVLSRCQRFDFKAIDSAEIKKRLNEVLSEIGKTAEEEALEMIAEAAEGGMRDALTILEKISSVQDNVTVSGVASVLNFAESGKIRKLLSYLSKYDEKNAMCLLLDIMDSGIEPATIVSQIISMLRELLIANVTESGKYLEDSKHWNKAGIIRALDIMADSEKRMSASVKPNIVLESSVMKLLLPERQDSSNDVELRIGKLEQKLSDIKKSGVCLNNDVIKSEKASKDNPNEVKTKALHVISDNAQEVWKNICESIKNNDIALYARIRGIEGIGFENNRLTLTSEAPSKVNLLNAGNTKNIIEEYAAQILGTKIVIETLTPQKNVTGIPDDIEIID